MRLAPQSQLYFEKLVERRHDYLVEYAPWAPHTKVALLSVTVKYPSSNQLDEILNNELKYWLGRYPVPLLVNFYDYADEPLDGHPNLPPTPIAAWLNDQKKITISNNLTELDVNSHEFESAERLLNVYADIPHKTSTMRNLEIAKNVRQTLRVYRFIGIVTFLRVAAVPAAWAIIQYIGPDWLARIVLLSVIAQATWAVLKMYRIVSPTKAEQERLKIETKKAHYFYHCEQNPVGFQRLKNENTESESRAANQEIEAKLRAR